MFIHCGQTGDYRSCFVYVRDEREQIRIFNIDPTIHFLRFDTVKMDQKQKWTIKGHKRP